MARMYGCSPFLLAADEPPRSLLPDRRTERAERNEERNALFRFGRFFAAAFFSNSPTLFLRDLTLRKRDVFFCMPRNMGTFFTACLFFIFGITPLHRL
jgi:hypothetical protein